MDLNEQRQWYEDWHTTGSSDLPVERMKQSMRLTSIAKSLQSVDDQRMLVIGCGEGHELQLVKPELLVALDLSHTAVKKASDLVAEGFYMQANGMELPFPDGHFDVILTSEVIEHILEPQQMMKEVVRVLKPGGSLVISTPNWMSFFGLARRMGEVILRRPVTSDDQPVDNWSTPHSLKGLLENAGLQVVNQRGAWYFPPTGLGRKRLPDGLMAQIFNVLLPLERWLQGSLPGWGHLLVMVARRAENS